jgi:spermidine synthase
VPDPARPGVWTLLVDGVEQSSVDLGQPRNLHHSYVRRIASVIDTAAPAGVPLRVLHLGGGALTLPRYVAATRPGSAQRVIERDAGLDRLVRQRLPLPPEADIRTAYGDARDAVVSMDGSFDASFDLVITDVYDGARMPASVASLEFVRQVARLLRPGGTYVVNVTDLPPGLTARIQAATLRAVFAGVCAIAEPGMLRGRRYGNVVLAAAADFAPVRLARLARIAAQDHVRARVLAGAELDSYVGGVGPMRDA